MAYILSLETTTEVCSVALSRGTELLHLEETAEPFQHGKMISIYMERCLQAVGIDWKTLDAVAVSSGPGSYTGLRVGTSAAKAICYAHQIPLLEVDTLYALARAMQHQSSGSYTYYVPMIDARRMEVYLAVYDAQLSAHWPVKAMVIDAHTFQDMPSKGRLLLGGNGAPKLQEVLGGQAIDWYDVSCSAKWLVEPAFEQWKQKNFQDVAYYRPQYVKPPNITQSKKKPI
jgi:tRNA threonylcarbamoyladenosine biosynthesis protein TsaB